MSTTAAEGKLLPPDWLRTHRTMAAALLDVPVTGATLPELVPCFGSSLALLVRDLWIEHAAGLV